MLLLGQEFTVKLTGLGEKKTNQPPKNQAARISSRTAAWVSRPPPFISSVLVEAFSGLPEGISPYTFSELSVILLLNIYHSDQ